jgi:energy-coupling factor transporter ATP-binding protein EcfA2
MRDRIVGLLEKIDAAVAESIGVIAEPDLRPIAQAGNEIRRRLAYPEEILLVALVGGTGSGKSSLFNAIAGTEIAEVGGIRPTTSRPMALVPKRHRDSVGGLLDHIGIDLVHLVESPDWICLIDMPDTDSVEVGHRQTVGALLPLVDLVVWVADPEKYRDAAFHTRLLAPLARYHRQFLFVLNQADRLSHADLGSVTADLHRALAEDGIPEPNVLQVSAAPPAGPPIGVDELMGALESLRADRSPVYHKLMTDVGAVASSLLAEMGGGRGLEFEKGWNGLLDEVAEYVATGEDSTAGHRLGDWLQDLGDRAAGELRDPILSMGANAPLLLEEALAEVEPPRGETSAELGSMLSRLGRALSAIPWSSNPRRGRQLRRVLDEGVGRDIRKLLAARARSLAAMAELSVSLAESPVDEV